MEETTQTYTGINPQIFECLKQNARDREITYPEGNNGQMQIKVDVKGTVLLDFKLDTDAETMKLTIAKMPPLVTELELWNILTDHVNRCRTHGNY